jgi:hypothetical protein
MGKEYLAVEVREVFGNGFRVAQEVEEDGVWRQIHNPDVLYWLRQVALPNEEKIDWLEIFQSEAHVLGSLKNLELTMNFEDEWRGIQTCAENYQREEEGTEVELQSMIFELLADQWAYYLSEFGCDKFLSIQPPHTFEVGRANDALFVSPVGLKSFGDHARRFVESNQEVGEGLLQVYEHIWLNMAGSMAGVMSPTEMYQKYHSKTDVINVLGGIGVENNMVLAQGQYLVLGKVLSDRERRFVHNLFGKLGEGLMMESLENMSYLDLVEAIGVDRLDSFEGEGEEYEHLVEKPNLFFSPKIEWYEFAQQLNAVFFKRFGKPLLEQTDIEMYPIIQVIVKQHAGNLFDLFTYKDKMGYYQELGRMAMRTQAMWKLIRGSKEGKVGESLYDGVADHYYKLQAGLIIAGFEIGFSDPLSGNGFDSPWGYDQMLGNIYCQKHEYWHSGSCPKCAKSKELLAKAENKKRE